jgi:hypothetical protein
VVNEEAAGETKTGAFDCGLDPGGGFHAVMEKRAGLLHMNFLCGRGRL